MKALYLVLAFVISLSSCNNTPHEENKNTGDVKHATSTSNKQTGLPFVGVREFETRPGISSTGTPHRSIEIKANGAVYFSFGQINQADGTETTEQFFAGKFKKYMVCVFKKLDNETTYYEITKDTIYEVDRNNIRVKHTDCREPDCGAPDSKEAIEEGYTCKSALTQD